MHWKSLSKTRSLPSALTTSMLTKLIILLNSIQKFYLTFPKKKLKSPKVPESFGKTYFQRKVNKSEKKKFVRTRERDWIIKLLDMYYIIYTDWKCVKVQKKGSKYIYVAMVTDNLNWWLIAIKFSTLFLHLTFAVPIKLHLAARATITSFDFSSLPKGKINYKWTSYF